MGLVVFARKALHAMPHHHWTTTRWVEVLGGIKTGMVEDGTAIGDGLSSAVSRIKNSTAKSKVIILLTDGVNNRGNVSSYYRRQK